MKISIWQQFSSNHSTYFVVVGRFANPKDAEIQTDRLRDWMYRMMWGNDRLAAEREIKTKYDLEWYEDGMDWNGWPYDVDHVVGQAGSDVFLMCEVETRDSHKPFVELMNKLGARKLWSYQHGEFAVPMQLTVVAPSEREAAIFCDTLKKLKEEYSSWELKAIWLNPWHPFFFWLSIEAQHQGTTVYMTLSLEIDRIVQFVSYLNLSGFSVIEYDFDTLTANW